MTAENQDISTTAGDAFVRTFTITEGGSVKDITDSTPAWSIARSAGGQVALSESDSGVTATVTDAAAGEVTLTVTAEATEPLRGDYVHELELEGAGGAEVTVARGVLSVVPETTD